MVATIKLDHEEKLKIIDRCEVSEIALETIQADDDGSFTYKATITTKFYYVESQANDTPSDSSRDDWNVEIMKDEKGEYKIINYEVNIPGLG